LLLGRCSRQLRESCAGANTVYSRAERVFILEHYFASKSFAAVREEFSNAYPDKEAPNMTTIHRLETKLSSRMWWTFTTPAVKLFCITIKRPLVCLVILMSPKLTNTEISGSHGGVYQDGCLLGCCAV
jgi:hypothetical protein